MKEGAGHVADRRGAEREGSVESAGWRVPGVLGNSAPGEQSSGR